MSRRAAAVLTAFAIFTGVAQQNQPGNPQTVLRSTSQEVLLDFIARDKHQKLVTDLRAEDIEVLEDGVPQTVRSFQYRGGQGDPRGRMGRRLRTQDPARRPHRFEKLIWYLLSLRA